jgi:hypothetical protein
MIYELYLILQYNNKYDKLNDYYIILMRGVLYKAYFKGISSASKQLRYCSMHMPWGWYSQSSTLKAKILSYQACPKEP